MSSFAVAHDIKGRGRRFVQRRRHLQTIALPWSQVPVVRRAFVPAVRRRGRWLLAALLITLAVALHVVFVWYIAQHADTTPARPRKHEVAVQLVAPPPPPPPPIPKVDPPKPPPQRLVKRQVLPQIQAPARDTPAVDATSSGPPVAVAPSAPESLAPPPPPPPEVVTAPFGRAGYLNNPPPSYPSVAARQGWQGTVLLRVRVLSSGRVDSVEVQKTSGHKLLDDEAIATVRGWQFTPSKRGETPIDGWATVPIEFKLDT